MHRAKTFPLGMDADLTNAAAEAMPVAAIPDAKLYPFDRATALD